MAFFKHNGLTLYYEEAGTSRPVVLLHGFTSSLVGNWRRRGWIGLLAKRGFRVVAFDFPSHGRSERTYDEARCSTESLGADVVGLLDHLGVADAALIGFSMGGGVALHVAINRPDRVAKVVVGGVGDAAVNALHDPRDIQELVKAFEADSADDTHVAARIRRNAERAGNDLAALLPYLRHGGWPGGLPDTGPVRAPVMLILAGNDQYMTGAEALRAWLPHATVFDAVGRNHHDVFDDAGVRDAVVEFLSDD